MTGSFWWDQLIGIAAAILLAWLALVLLLHAYRAYCHDHRQNVNR
jgi:cbb3-type cytochrome oxidase subunit 3